MPNYRYAALDNLGRRVSGEMVAANQEELVRKLASDGLRVTSIASADNEAAAEAEPGAGPLELSDHNFQSLSVHIADLTSSNLPLVPGLRAIAEELPRGRLQRGLRAIVSALKSGEELASALESRRAPTDLVALVRAGAQSGRTGEILTQYLNHIRCITALRRRVLLNLAYPALLFVAGVGVLLFILLWIVPLAKPIYEDFGMELPGVTQLLIFVSDVVVDYGLAVLGGLAIVLFLVWMLLKSYYGASWQRLVHLIPVAGPLLRSLTLARFSSLLALLVENDMPLPEAIQLAGDGTRDAAFREACRVLVADSLARGEPFELTAHEMPVFPAVFVQVLNWKEQRAALPDALRALAEIFEREAHTQAGVATVILAPFVVILTGLFVGFGVVAFYMPMIKLLNALS